MKKDEGMQLEDLKTAWAQLDQRVGGDLTRMEAITQALVDERTRSLVQQTVWLPIVELVATLAGLSLVIVGLMQTGGTVYYTCLNAIFFLFTLLILSAICQITMSAKVDPTAPVIATQRQLGKLRALRIFEGKWMLLLSPVLWAPFLVVIVEMFLKIVVGYEETFFSAGFVQANVIIGLIMTGGLMWMSRTIAKRWLSESFMSDLFDEFAGSRLTAAREFLTRLDGYERE